MSFFKFVLFYVKSEFITWCQDVLQTVTAFVCKATSFTETCLGLLLCCIHFFLTLWMLCVISQFSTAQRIKSLTSLCVCSLPLLVSHNDIFNRATAGTTNGQRPRLLSFLHIYVFVLLKLGGFGFINRAEEVTGSRQTLSYCWHFLCFCENPCSLHTVLDSQDDMVITTRGAWERERNALTCFIEEHGY